MGGREVITHCPRCFLTLLWVQVDSRYSTVVIFMRCVLDRKRRDWCDFALPRAVSPHHADEPIPHAKEIQGWEALAVG